MSFIKEQGTYILLRACSPETAFCRALSLTGLRVVVDNQQSMNLECESAWKGVYSLNGCSE